MFFIFNFYRQISIEMRRSPLSCWKVVSSCCENINIGRKAVFCRNLKLIASTITVSRKLVSIVILHFCDLGKKNLKPGKSLEFLFKKSVGTLLITL